MARATAAAKKIASSTVGQRVAGKATEKVAETRLGQQFLNRVKEIFEGPNRGKALVATGILGALTLYALGPARLLRYVPLAVAGVRRVMPRA